MVQARVEYIMIFMHVTARDFILAKQKKKNLTHAG